MKSHHAPISFLSTFLGFSLSSTTLVANPLPQQPATPPQLDFSSEPDFFSSPNLEFHPLQPQQQQPFPFEAATKSNTKKLLVADNNNNQPTIIHPAPGSSHHCNTLHPRSDQPDTDMCPINMEETSNTAPDWDPNDEWKEYLRKYPPGAADTQTHPQGVEGEEEGYRALKDESVGTGCTDRYHRYHLCCAGPAGRKGLYGIRPDDISYIQHCALCMWGSFFFFGPPSCAASSFYFILSKAV